MEAAVSARSNDFQSHSKIEKKKLFLKQKKNNIFSHSKIWKKNFYKKIQKKNAEKC